MSRGARSNYSFFRMGAHTGTHVDAPRHMIDGAAAVDQLDPSALVGPAEVIELHVVGAILPEHLQDHDWASTERVLLRTSNSGKLSGRESFTEDFVYLSGEAAEFLVRQELKAVGVDYLSVDRFHSDTHPAHMALMRAGIVIIEGLDLSGVPAGRYEMFCGPLKVAGAEGAPARVFLVDRHG